jgi:anti-sigma factor RsiW
MPQLDVKTETWIDQYLRKELSAEDAAALEARMQADPDFLQEVALRRDIVVGIRVAEDRQFRERLEHISIAVEQGNVPMPRRKGRSPRVLWAGLIVGGAVVVAWLVWRWLSA